MKTNEAGIDLIKSFEDLRLDAYICPAGKVTIGYGHTKDVKLGDKITKYKAEKFLKEDLAEAEQAVIDCVEVSLNENQFSALVSFVFNLGKGALRSSTLLRLLNQKKYSEVRNQFMRWVYATDPSTGRKVQLKGLVRRREAEAKLFNS